MSAAILGGIAAGALLQPFLDPLTRSLGYGLNENLPTVILTPNQLIDLHHRSAITQNQYFSLMQKHGYTIENAKLYYYAADSLITPEQSVSLLIHDRLNLFYQSENNQVSTTTRIDAEITTQQNYRTRLKRNGYRPSESQDLFNANRPLPTFSTILEWMSKEVFEPDKITKFTLDQEQPPELALYMGAYGVPTAEARKYWISHWNTIGRASWDNLYQRFRSDRNTATYSDIDPLELAEAGVSWDDVKISEQDYNDYYTVLELSPYFRSRGRGAVYNPLPFTVLQQLWQFGVLTYNEMIGRLRDYGYSKRSSELIMTAWQRKFPYGFQEPLRDNILRKLSIGRISTAAARTELAAAGVTSDAITFLINKTIDERILKRDEIKFKTLTNKILKFKKTAVEIQNMVNSAFPHWTTEEKSYRAQLIENKIAEYNRRVNLRIIGKALGEGSITEAEFRTFCESRFIPTSDINLAIKAYNPSSNVDINAGNETESNDESTPTD